MFKRASRLAAVALAIAAAGCSGSDGAQGPAGAQGPMGPQGVPGQDLVATAKPEACASCHGSGGSDHQSVYNQYKSGGSLAVTTNSVVTAASGVTTWTFTVTKNGVPFQDPNLSTMAQKSFTAGQFDTTNGFLAKTATFKAPTTVSLVDGQYAVTVSAGFAPEAGPNTYVFGYLASDLLPTERPKNSNDHVTLYANVVDFGQTFNSAGAGNLDAWVSKANVSACENCHGAPYRKHGYRMAKVAGLPDFVGCKACHYDSRVGGDFDWQVMSDDPVSYATTGISTAQKTKYAYKAKLMNDVHMSHAMEFDFPQSMSNCVTCHAGKLTGATGILDTDTNFKIETCKSCHPVTGPAAKYVDGHRAPALITLMTNPALGYTHGSETAVDPATGVSKLYSNATSCAACHNNLSGGLASGAAPYFSEIHSGFFAGFYRPTASSSGAQVYTAAQNKFSDLFNVTVDSAALNGATLTVSFTGHRTAVVDADPTVVASITPTLIVGLYGYDTKDFIVDPHTGSALEWKYGSTNPRFKNFSKTTPDASTITWQVDVDLSAWQPMFATTIKRAEIAVLPTLTDSSGKVTYALNAPSKTFNLSKNAFESFFSPIVDVNKCNKCHEALATTFHAPDRSGNITVCRLCHNVRNGAFHLELQSRSIDSYVHAIHSFQQLNVGVAPSPYGQPVDFTDPVQGMRYGIKNEATYPMFTMKNCESCHNPGTYNPPANDRSLPGVISGSWSNMTGDRNLGSVPSYVTGPGARACGSCHLAAAIKEDVPAGTVKLGAAVAGDPQAASEVTAFVDKSATEGYALAPSALDAAIAKIMSFFK